MPQKQLAAITGYYVLTKKRKWGKNESKTTNNLRGKTDRKRSYLSISAIRKHDTLARRHAFWRFSGNHQGITF